MPPTTQSLRPLHQLLGARYAIPHASTTQLTSSASSPTSTTSSAITSTSSLPQSSAFPSVPIQSSISHLTSRTSSTLHPSTSVTPPSSSSQTTSFSSLHSKTPAFGQSSLTPSSLPESRLNELSSTPTRAVRMAPSHIMRSAQYTTSAFRTPSLRTNMSGARMIHHTSRSMQYKKEDVMDRNALNPQSTEYSKTGGDASASHTDEAFDSKKTRAEEYNGPDDANSPLNVSPGNKEARKGPDRQAELKTKASRNEGGPEQASGGGNSAKSSSSKR